jgi:hypothetical protein
MRAMQKMEPRERPPAPPPNVRQACLITHLGSDPADQRLVHISRLGSPMVMRSCFSVILISARERLGLSCGQGKEKRPPNWVA